VLLTIGQQVAEVVGEPVARLSVEMVFRAFYHYSRAVQCGEADALVLLLAEPAKFLGLVKRGRKPHRERQQLAYLIWGDLSVETGDTGGATPRRAGPSCRSGVGMT
jgi:hypothetical protein